MARARPRHRFGGRESGPLCNRFAGDLSGGWEMKWFHRHLRAPACLLCSLLLAPCFLVVSAQNIIEDGAVGKTAPPIQVTREQAEAVVRRAVDFSAWIKGKEAERVRAKLEKHVTELLAGAPWKPFHHTLGISGYE